MSARYGRRDFLKTVAAGSAAFMMPSLARAQNAGDGRPNVLLIMADDMGFSDIGCYGARIIQTPTINSLADRGMRFTQFYNNAKCSPTRGSLLTGQYSGWRGSPSRHVNLAAQMKEAGYRTYMTGKVHGHSTAGFDRSCTMGACASYWNLGRYQEGPGVLNINGEPHPDFLETHPDFYATDAWSDYAVRFLDQDRGSERPFFLYVAYNAPHYPLHARQADIEEYRGRFMEGWDVLRRRRFGALVEAGIVGPDLRMSPRDEGVPSWSSQSREEKEQWDLWMATYAAMIDCMDRGIGRILVKIRELGQEGNTLVFFLSDNGGCAKTGGKPPGSEPGPPGTWHFVGKPWANTSNTPWRKFKTWDHEGGVSTPLIASWPERIRPGCIDRDWGHVVDITATCLDVAGRPNDKILGLPLTPAFDGNRRQFHDVLCWAILKGKAAREGRWKAVRYEEVGWNKLGDESYDIGIDDLSKWRLFDMEADRTELHDLSKQHPERLRHLVETWKAWNEKVSHPGQRPV